MHLKTENLLVIDHVRRRFVETELHGRVATLNVIFDRTVQLFIMYAPSDLAQGIREEYTGTVSLKSTFFDSLQSRCLSGR